MSAIFVHSFIEQDGVRCITRLIIFNLRQERKERTIGNGGKNGKRKWNINIKWFFHSLLFVE